MTFRFEATLHALAKTPEKPICPNAEGMQINAKLTRKFVADPLVRAGRLFDFRPISIDQDLLPGRQLLVRGLQTLFFGQAPGRFQVFSPLCVFVVDHSAQEFGRMPEANALRPPYVEKFLTRHTKDEPAGARICEVLPTSEEFENACHGLLRAVLRVGSPPGREETFQST